VKSGFIDFGRRVVGKHLRFKGKGRTVSGMELPSMRTREEGKKKRETVEYGHVETSQV
jgi:hypothetical protein